MEYRYWNTPTLEYLCIRKTSQTDIKGAVREASLIPIVVCLNAAKIGSPFHISYIYGNVLRHKSVRVAAAGYKTFDKAQFEY